MERLLTCIKRDLIGFAPTVQVFLRSLQVSINLCVWRVSIEDSESVQVVGEDDVMATSFSQGGSCIPKESVS